MLEEIINNNKKTIKVAITTNIQKDIKEDLTKFCKVNNLQINVVIESLISKLLEEVNSSKGYDNV